MTRWWRQNNRCTRWTLQWCRQNSSADTSPAVVDQLWRLATKKTVARYRWSEERYRRGRTCHSCQGCGQYRCRGIPSKRIVSSYHKDVLGHLLFLARHTRSTTKPSVERVHCAQTADFFTSLFIPPGNVWIWVCCEKRWWRYSQRLFYVTTVNFHSSECHTTFG